jgi:hypothetical protein
VIAVIGPVRQATLFWRLAVLRRQLERARVEADLLSQLSQDEDLSSQLSEASRFVGEAVDYLAPAPEHVDNAVEK